MKPLVDTLTPILQSFTIKTNVSIDLDAFFQNAEPVQPPARSGSVLGMKFGMRMKGDLSLFKTNRGFKNACHLVMMHTIDRRNKKPVHVKMTAIGTFQVVGVSSLDVEKIVYKIFLLLEKLKVITATKSHLRLEMIIIPILHNYVVDLPPEILAARSPQDLIRSFVDNNMLSFVVPADPAITVKKAYAYNEFKYNLVTYVVFTKTHPRRRIRQQVEYGQYISLLSEPSQEAARAKKYVTFRVYRTGKILVSGFDDTLVQHALPLFLDIISSSPQTLQKS